MFHGPIHNEANAGVRDISWREIGAVAPLLAGIVFLGVYPKPFLDRVTPSVNHLLAHVQTVDPSAHVPPSGATPLSYSVPANQNVEGPARRRRLLVRARVDGSATAVAAVAPVSPGGSRAAAAYRPPLGRRFARAPPRPGGRLAAGRRSPPGGSPPRRRPPPARPSTVLVVRGRS